VLWRMPGRGSLLFALLFLIVVPILPAILLASLSVPLAAQSSRADVSPPILPPRLPLPPTVGPPVRPPGSIGLSQLSQAAGTIFSGSVTAVERHPASSQQAIETVSITFHVDQAIRGVIPGEDFTISQWIALWSSGQRYRVGERVLLFLYPPSKLGLTSCVGGGFGRFTVDPSGEVFFTAQHRAAFRADPILGGRARASFSDLALAVQRAELQRAEAPLAETGGMR